MISQIYHSLCPVRHISAYLTSISQSIIPSIHHDCTSRLILILLYIDFRPGLLLLGYYNKICNTHCCTYAAANTYVYIFTIIFTRSQFFCFGSLSSYDITNHSIDDVGWTDLWHPRGRMSICAITVTFHQHKLTRKALTKVATFIIRKHR